MRAWPQLKQAHLNPVAGVVHELSSRYNGFAKEGIGCVFHGCHFLSEIEILYCGTPKLFSLGVGIPGIDVVVHDETKARELREVKPCLDCLFKCIPASAEVFADNASSGAAHRMDATACDKLVQRAVAALINTGLQPRKGLFAGALRLDDRIAVAVQRI